MADAFDAVADETRRRILSCLAEDGGELNVGTLVERLGFTQPTISKHLKVLRDVGLVSVREEGQRRFYHVDLGGFAPISDWVAGFLPPEPVPESVAAPAGAPDGAPAAGPDGYKATSLQADRLGFPPPSASSLARTTGRWTAAVGRAIGGAVDAVRGWFPGGVK